MQKTFVKIISRKVLTAAFLTSTAATDASVENKELNSNFKIVTTNIESSIEFTGANENTIFFDIKVENPDGDKFALEIQDDEANVLFSKNYTHANLVEKVKLPNEKLIAHYNFMIRPHNKEAEQSFVVSINNKIIDEAEAA
jgi:hypothetical protein